MYWIRFLGQLQQALGAVFFVKFCACFLRSLVFNLFFFMRLAHTCSPSTRQIADFPAKVCSPERPTLSDRPTPSRPSSNCSRHVAVTAAPRTPASPVATEIDSDGPATPSPRSRSIHSRSQQFSPSQHSPATKSTKHAGNGEDDLLLLLQVGGHGRTWRDSLERKMRKITEDQLSLTLFTIFCHLLTLC